MTFENKWDSDKSKAFEGMESLSDRIQDLKRYKKSSSFIAGVRHGEVFKLIDTFSFQMTTEPSPGSDEMYLEIAAGAFAGISHDGCDLPSFKSFTGVQVKGAAFGRSFDILSAKVSAEKDVNIKKKESAKVQISALGLPVASKS